MNWHKEGDMPSNKTLRNCIFLAVEKITAPLHRQVLDDKVDCIGLSLYLELR